VVDESQVDQLLDEWDEQLDVDDCADIDDFIAKHSSRLVDENVEKFRRKAIALAKMNGHLAAMGDTDSLSPETSRHNHGRQPPSTLQPGQEPIPGYQLLEPLGQGGFGQVWKALGPGQFPVALKFVRLDERTGQTELRSLDIIRDVRHPHLLSVFGTWQIGNQLVIASELADESLQDRFEAVRRENGLGIPQKELFRYMIEAAKGIDFLNQAQGSNRAGIQHRDIKPQNLLISGGSIKVGDFGLVRSLKSDATGHTGSLTLAYAAPEFLAGKTSNRSDQYSLAVTYCYLRTGVLPFTGSAIDIIDGHRSGKPDLSQLGPRERKVVEKALSKNPHDRWKSCQTFVKALIKANTVVSKESLPAKNLAQTQRESSHNLKRWKWPIVGLIALLVFSALVIVLPDVRPNFIGDVQESSPSNTANNAAPIPVVRVEAQNAKVDPNQPKQKAEKAKQEISSPITSPESVWRSLFNGENLNGWSTQGYNGWKVEDGILLGETNSKQNIGYLMTDDRFENFELKLEFRLSAASNSGVFLNAMPGQPLDGSRFIEVQLLDQQHPRFSSLPDFNRSGSLFRVAAARPLDLQSNTWHQLVVLKQNGRVMVNLNGNNVLDQAIDSSTDGHIALQLYPTRVEFRDIQIRDFNKEPTKQLSNADISKSIQGEWKLVEEILHDGPVPIETLNQRNKRLRIEGVTFRIEYNSASSDDVNEEQGTIIFEAEEDPVKIDMPYQNKQGKQLVYRGILQLEGNRIRHRFIKLDPGETSTKVPMSFNQPLLPGTWEDVYVRTN